MPSQTCPNSDMPQKHYPNLTEALRSELAADARSYAEVSRQTGVSRQSLMGFAAGERSLRLDLADKLAEFYGLEVSSRKESRGQSARRNPEG